MHSTSGPQENLLKNQDLLRTTLHSLDLERIVMALRWLRGDAPYPYPVSVHLDLTLRCTAQCVHCKQWTWPKRNELSLTQLDRVFAIFYKWGVKTLTLGGGNPFLHTNICAALKMAHDRGFQVGIISEGITISDELADTICECAQWIRFSLDGPRPEVHDKIRHKVGLFELVIQNISSLVARNSPLHVSANCIVQKENIHCLPSMIDLAENVGLKTLIFKIAHGDDPNNLFIPSSEQLRKFAEWINVTTNITLGQLQTNLSQLRSLLGTVFKYEDILRGRPVRSFLLQEQIHCFVPLFFLTCDSEGYIYPCDYLQADTRQWGGEHGTMRDMFCLGNILEDSRQIIENIAVIMRHCVHVLPSTGHSECGCCTRFCQLNASLTYLKDQLHEMDINLQNITDVLGFSSGTISSSGFL
jgi:MoaA/NifB/PqqE/SkfB family radical SAM enzyme